MYCTIYGIYTCTRDPVHVPETLSLPPPRYAPGTFWWGSCQKSSNALGLASPSRALLLAGHHVRTPSPNAIAANMREWTTRAERWRSGGGYLSAGSRRLHPQNHAYFLLTSEDRILTKFNLSQNCLRKIKWVTGSPTMSRDSITTYYASKIRRLVNAASRQIGQTALQARFGCIICSQHCSHTHLWPHG